MTAVLTKESPYPVSESWAELAINASAFVGGVVACHYIDTILCAFDAALKKGISRVLGLCVKSEGGGVYTKVDLARREEARSKIVDALFQLHVAATLPESNVYWLRDARIDGDGTINFDVSCFRQGGAFGERRAVRSSDPDYAFYRWVVTEKRPAVLLSASGLADLRSSFSKRSVDPESPKHARSESCGNGSVTNED
ncbi:MAG: hypothetical protein HKL96_01790 [Phycisphaerales bacterium]|nr:hypothetical protein [Phycisphaerales bacterium]